MNIGFIGLGNVGGKLAGSLIRNGYSLSVRDLDRSQAEPLLQMGASWDEGGGSFHTGPGEPRSGESRSREARVPPTSTAASPRSAVLT